MTRTPTSTLRGPDSRMRRRLSWLAFSAALLGLAALAMPACSRPSRKVTRGAPNIVLIVIDTLRADHLGTYGYARPTSPNLDRLAADAVVFERVVTQGGWTRPAMASLFTSLYPHVHGAFKSNQTLPAEATTLAESLQEAGYRTMGLQTNPFISGARNLAQGFREYYERYGANGETLMNALFRWLDRHGETKFFAYVHLMDVHLPYESPEANRVKFDAPYHGQLDPNRVGTRKQILKLLPTLTDEDKRHVIALYDAGVNYADEQIGRMIDALRERKLLDNTIIVITADHGEELFDRGGYEHGHSLYKEVSHIPLIIRTPRHAGHAVRVRQLVRLIDVYPTILGLVGLSIPSAVMGRDLSPAMDNPDLDWDLAGFTEATMYGPPQLALEQGPFKLLVIAPPKGSTETQFFETFPWMRGSPESGFTGFYDLRRDPGEHARLPDHPLQARLLSALQDERSVASDRALTGAEETPDKETLERLKSLGYVR
jgi:arylsulfatase A-like enzyme